MKILIQILNLSWVNALLCCSVVAILPLTQTHTFYLHWQWCGRERERGMERERGVHQYDSSQSNTSWPADSFPSEILSEDYKTNQQAVIAAASLWLDHNPATAISSEKRINEGREEWDAGKEMKKEINKERNQWEPIVMREYGTQRTGSFLPSHFALLARFTTTRTQIYLCVACVRSVSYWPAYSPSKQLSIITE